MKVTVCPSSKTITMLPDKEVSLDIEKAREILDDNAFIIRVHNPNLVVGVRPGGCHGDIVISVMKSGKVLIRGISEKRVKEYEDFANEIIEKCKEGN